MGDTLQITPFMHVRELEPAVAFLVDVLGFEVVLRVGRDYAYLDREGAGLRVMAYPDAHLFEGGRDRFAYYIDVRDVDSVYAELKGRLEALPAGTCTGRRTRNMGSGSC